MITFFAVKSQYHCDLMNVSISSIVYTFHIPQTEDGYSYTSQRLTVPDRPYTAPCHVIHCAIITPAKGHVAAAEQKAVHATFSSRM